MSNFPLKSTKNPLLKSENRSGSCVGEPRINLLECLKSKNLTSFLDVLTNEVSSSEDYPLPSSHWVNVPIDSEDGKTILFLALESGEAEFVSLLLKFGANVNEYNESYGQYPIHVASRNKDLRSLELLFRHSENSADSNALMRINGRSALHIMAENNFIDGVEFMLRQKPKVDIQDKKGGMTPLFIAALKRNDQKIILELLKYGADPDVKSPGGKSIRNLINQYYDIALDDKISKAPAANADQTTSIERLGEIIETLGLGQGNYYRLLNEFQFGLIQYKQENIESFRYAGNMSLLQKICSESLEDCAKFLFNSFPSMSPDARNEGGLAPVCIAAMRRSRPILQLLSDKKADFTVCDTHSSRTILHLILKDNDKKFPEALHFLLNSSDIEPQIRSIINKRDSLGNTPLHYATQKWDQTVVKQLLQLGANIGMKNLRNEIPVTNILPSTMEEFLNEDCLKYRGDVNHDDFELEFDYSFLAPPYEDLPHEYLDESDEMVRFKSGYQKSPYHSALPEMNSLWIMGQSKEHRHLLKHPVIASFLWCKWGRIRPYFNRNLRFFLTFVFLSTWFIFENFGGRNIKNDQGYITLWYALFVIFAVVITWFIIRDWKYDVTDMMANIKNSSTGKNLCSVLVSSWLEIGLIILLFSVVIFGEPSLRIALLISLLCLTAREILQLAVSVKRYVLSPENWVEVLLILFISILLFDNERSAEETDLKRHLSAITIILSWAEMITLIGKHPKLTRYNVYVTMFYKVMKTFFFFLIWYALFILAFGMGFYIMLHKENREEDGYVYFDTPLLSLIKTSTMFVGELEFSDIPVEGVYSPLSYAYFLTFVFLIVVVLMNLLNGLAVSDTGIIQEKAEIVGYVSRVETISYTESVLLGDPFDFLSNWPKIKLISGIPSISFLRQLYRNKCLQKIFHRVTGATGILLFYSFLPEKRLCLKPNEKIYGCPCLKVDYMDYGIIASAKKIILNEQSKKETVDIKELSVKVDLLVEMLRKNEERQNLWMDKFTLVETPLETWAAKP